MEKIDNYFSSNRSFKTAPAKLSNPENHISVSKTGQIILKTSAARAKYVMLNSGYICEWIHTGCQILDSFRLETWRDCDLKEPMSLICHKFTYSSSRSYFMFCFYGKISDFCDELMNGWEPSLLPFLPLSI